MTFYSGLRDNTAAPLIAQFGQAATYRVYEAATYDNTTGKTAQGAPTDVALRLLDLPMREREFSEEVTARASGMFLVEAKAFADATVTPSTDAIFLLNGKEYRILAINTVGPAGTAVIYKMAVQNV